MKKYLDTAKNNLLLITLVMQPFLDILAYIQSESPVSLAGYIRLGLTFMIPAYVLFFARERKKFIISMAVIAGFCLLHILNGFRVGYISLFTDVKYMLLVCHAIVLMFSFMFLYEKQELLRQIKTALKVVIVAVAATYYLSYILKSGSHTYVDSYIGWTGWNNTPSVFSIILSAIFPFAAYFCISSSKKWTILFLLPLSYMYILNATKAAYLTLIGTLFCFAVFLAVEFFIKRKDKFPVLVILTLVALMISSVALYNYSPRHDIDTLNNISLQQGNEMLSNKDDEDEDLSVEEIFVKYLDKAMIKRFGQEKFLAAYNGELTAENLADNRLKKIIFGSLVWEQTDTLTKFVGFEQTQMYIGNETYDLESDPQAIYFYYGYIGSALFAGLLLYFLLRILKQVLFHFKESFNFFNFTIFLAYGLLLVSTVYTGHLLRRPNSAIYLAVVLLLIYIQTEPLFKKKKAEKV